jgi:hypothetical protein
MVVCWFSAPLVSCNLDIGSVGGDSASAGRRPVVAESIPCYRCGCNLEIEREAPAAPDAGDTRDGSGVERSDAVGGSTETAEHSLASSSTRCCRRRGAEGARHERLRVVGVETGARSATLAGRWRWSPQDVLAPRLPGCSDASLRARSRTRGAVCVDAFAHQ